MHTISHIKDRIIEYHKHILVFILFLCFLGSAAYIIRDASMHSNGELCNQNEENALWKGIYTGSCK
ncbi:hypothetical protein CN918_30030 [Priestia megaterium]|nr:hypothetical protein CN918_30030 [Priestia megaterium]